MLDLMVVVVLVPVVLVVAIKKQILAQAFLSFEIIYFLKYVLRQKLFSKDDVCATVALVSCVQ